ncbi:unnamed protein product, partial [Phaeothamnion confervicola]
MQWLRVPGDGFECHGLVALELRLGELARLPLAQAAVDAAKAAEAAKATEAARQSGGVGLMTAWKTEGGSGHLDHAAAAAVRRSGRALRTAAQWDDDDCGGKRARRRKDTAKSATLPNAKSKPKPNKLKAEDDDGNGDGVGGEKEEEEKKIVRKLSAKEEAGDRGRSDGNCGICRLPQGAVPRRPMMRCGGDCGHSFHPLCVGLRDDKPAAAVGAALPDLPSFHCPSCCQAAGRPSAVATEPPPGYYRAPWLPPLPQVAALERALADAGALPLHLVEIGPVGGLRRLLRRVTRWQTRAAQAVAAVEAYEKGGRVAAGGVA